ncbi:3-dehydroquinate synthase [Mucilaginibacter arboris]|uniref:3-dehydroquinate synthase n=1 Tax=Mucilaginibacter arboris TaxID=2682090 RepID=A0A7K1SSX2_9SPHI|nr:3-dehydroquinate synthase [Mucilaginibacter arboris]MVN20401.1 3-dehydroquinate synthase [Mucilaginibacter arboris]
METIQSISYPVIFNDNFTGLNQFLQEGNYTKVFFLIDEQTEKHCLPFLIEHLKITDYDLIEVTSGEENKTIDFCIGIWKMLIDFGADRNSLLINVGGGVITDMGGFAASTFKRGIDFVQIPTTLLSQVDASVGGKTGIDMDHLKNIIGTFTQPKAVFIDTNFLKTLPERQLVSGFAEMLKHGLIADRDYFYLLKEASPEKIDPELIRHSVEIKNNIVLQDPEEKGLRKILNFGHTIGHAVESFSLQSGKNPLLHGEAVAIGMVCEAFLSVQKTGLPQDELTEIVQTLRRFYGKYPIKEASIPALIEIMKSDKKNASARINCSLLTQIGQCTIDSFCTEDELCASLLFYLNY